MARDWRVYTDTPDCKRFVENNCIVILILPYEDCRVENQITLKTFNW